MEAKNTSPKSLYGAPPAPSRFKRVQHVAHKIKEGGKELLNPQDDSDSDSDSDSLWHDPAFNPQTVLGGSPHKLGSVRDKLNHGIKHAADAVKNPRRAMRNRYTRRAAANLSTRPDNYIGVFDEELLDAHDQLFSALNSSVAQSSDESDVDASDPAAVDRARLRIDLIEDQRESRRNAWILGRHVVRAKVVRPIQTKPCRAQYTTIEDCNTKSTPTVWDRYLAGLALWHCRGFTSHHIDDFTQTPFDLRELALTIERLAVISTSWQALLIEVRIIYRWVNRQRTFRIMCLYWLLWYFQQIFAFVLVLGMYFVARNKIYPNSIESIRKRVQRTRDVEAKARAWNELIQRHGNQDWIEPLLDELGPLIQMHLGDLASFLEILQNFYRWERPRKTAATLFFFASLLLLVVFTSADFCLKLFWMGIGAVFFFSFPLSANYPKYRHLVNPLAWIFWDIPNAADLAIIQLQEKGLIRMAARADSICDDDNDKFFPASDDANSNKQIEERGTYSFNTPRSVLDFEETHTFRAVLHKPVDSLRDLVHSPILQHTHSRLTLTSEGMWLYNAHSPATFHHYTDLLEIRKIDLNKLNSEQNPNHHQEQHSPTHQDKPEPNADADDTDNQPDTPRQKSPSKPNLQQKTTKLARKLNAWTTLQVLPSGLELDFIAARSEENSETVTLVVSETDRDKIFSLVLGWSNVKWRPYFSLGRQNRLHLRDAKAGGNRGLDDALKRAIR